MDSVGIKYSSQTTTSWPITMRAIGTQHPPHVGISNHSTWDLTIHPTKEKSADEILEELLRDYAEVWERLAEL